MALTAAGMAFLGQLLKLQTLPLFAGYLLMVALSGVWKQMVPPFTNLRPLLIVHNFACCLASVCTLGGFAYCIWQSGSLYSRQTSSTLTTFFTLYWLTKVAELLDTVFMVLRHKVRQISFLHIYHHSSMLLLSELGATFYPWPAIAIFLAMNSFVHIVLYLYYGLTALSPDSPPTWKKQMTQIQIAQFFVGFVIAAFGYAYYNYCIYSILYGITMTWLFSNFYYHAYVKKRPVNPDVVQNGKID
ncbi:very long chain fatty acid elongase 4-like [Babylonia areolata]|uniref:very long chain fatty acid elongase 4-like n=1 Tax=Babylonia areolata TaxID=304850 RepID=UPI003FD694D0